MLRQWGLPGLLVVAGIIAYANAIGGAFVFDDIRGIVDRTGHFTQSVGRIVAGERRPLVTLSLAANHAIGGLDTRGYHVFNLAVHLATSLALFALIRRAAERLRPGIDGTPLAFAAAMLWTVHPLGTAAVTYVIQRAEAMAALCMVLVLLSVLFAASSTRPGRWTAAAVLAATLGMLSKPTMVAVVPLAILFDALVAAESPREAIRRRWGLHLMLLASCLLLVPTGLAGSLLEAAPNPEVGAGLGVTKLSPLEYLRSQPGVILHGIGQALWPATLCIDPDWPVARSIPAILWPSLALAAAMTATVVAIRRRHPLAFPAAAFFVLLAPTSTIVPIRDLAAEHRMYLPLAAIMVVVVAAVLHGLPKLAGRRAPVIGVSLLVLATAALAARTIDRNRDYATPATLWAATVAAAPHNHRARMNLGVALRAEGRDEEAVGHFEAALDMQSNDPVAQLNLGSALLDAGRIDEAAEVLSIAATRLRDRPRAWLLLGDAQRARGRSEDAIAAFRRAVEIRPEPAIRLRLGNALADAGRLEEAAEQFTAAAEEAGAEPELRASALFNLGNTRYRQQDYDLAIAAYDAALATDPGHDGARQWMAEARRRQDGP